MPNLTAAEEFRHRADQVRRIAESIFDHTERAFVFQFVEDCERRFASLEREIADDRT
jgi:hypothetical protein